MPRLPFLTAPNVSRGGGTLRRACLERGGMEKTVARGVFRPDFCVGEKTAFRLGGNFSMTLFLTIWRIFEYVCAHLGGA
jgi:hypothetical protein